MEFCDDCIEIIKGRRKVQDFRSNEYDDEICPCCKQIYSDHLFFLNKKCTIVDCSFKCRPPTVQLNSAVGWLYTT